MKRLLPFLLALILIMTACDGVASTQKLSFIEGKALTVPMNNEEMALVGVYFDYTNGSGETRMPCDDFEVKAFQNGIELNILVFTGTKTDGGIQCDTSVQSGITVKMVCLFVPEDLSTVTVECSDGQKYAFEVG